MAYGARLESGLGESPQGFKSPILRAMNGTRQGAVRISEEFDLGAAGPTQSAELAADPLSSAITKSAPGRFSSLQGN